MRVRAPRIETNATGARLIASLECDAGSMISGEFWIEVPIEYAHWLDDSGNAFVPFPYILASSRGEGLRIDAPICPRLAEGAQCVNRQFHEWWPDVSVATIEAARFGTDDRATGHAAIHFFTRGVDSTYGVMQAMEAASKIPVTHLVYLTNIIRHWSESTQQKILERTKEAAAALGLPLMPVRTNAIDFDPGPKRWYRMHGSLIASVALALGRGCRDVTIASTHDHFLREAEPWGSHKLIDPLWSTRWTAIQQDGWDKTRVEKIRMLAKRPELLRRLKFCQKEDTDSNCGRCWKCVQTLGGFYFAGVAVPKGLFETALTKESMRRHWRELERFFPEGRAKEELRAMARQRPALSRGLDWIRARVRSVFSS